MHGRARVHGDENGVGQVGEDDGESSRRPVRRARANDSKASRLGGRSDTRRHRRFDRFGLETGESITSCGCVREGLTGLTSKPGETGLTGLGLKTGGGLDAVKVRAEGTWRHRESCVVKAACLFGGSSEKMDNFASAWVCIVVNSVGVLSFVGTIYIERYG